MDIERLGETGLVLLGCGRMGSALLEGWLATGIRPDAVTVLDPHPSERLLALGGKGLKINVPVAAAGVCVLAVKPQAIVAVRDLSALGNASTLFISVAAGVTLAGLEAILGVRTPIIRAMPNMPAAIGKGVTAYFGNARCTVGDLELGEALLGAVGRAVRLEAEEQMDAVTGVSGSGPAYVFHLIEALTEAGEAEGLPADLARILAIDTVAGAGALAASGDADPAELRRAVTSPNGTTAAALDVLMAEPGGLRPLISRAVKAATARSRALAKG